LGVNLAGRLGFQPLKNGGSRGLQAPESRQTIKVALATGLPLIFSDALRSEGQTMERRTQKASL
jgi:hypothetical protein